MRAPECTWTGMPLMRRVTTNFWIRTILGQLNEINDKIKRNNIQTKNNNELKIDTNKL